MLTAELFLACTLSAAIWLIFAIYARKLGLVAIEHTSLYSFIIAIDLTMCYKQPVFQFTLFNATIREHTSFRLCVIALIATVAAAVFGLWLDSRAESHLKSLMAVADRPRPPVVSAWLIRRAVERFSQVANWVSDTVRLRYWYGWRNLHAGLILLLATAHIYGLVSIVEMPIRQVMK